MDATLSTLESEASSMNAQMTMASVMTKTTKTLVRLNRMVSRVELFRIENEIDFDFFCSDAITRLSKDDDDVRTKYDCE